MAKAKATIKWPVPAGYKPGDYAVLCANDGLGGAVDFNNQISTHDLFRRGAGIYSVYRTPCYTTRCYKPSAQRTGGPYSTPCYKGCCGHTPNVIETTVDIAECGSWKYAFAVYDSLGNIYEGTAEEVAIEVHIEPDKPTGLKKVSYNKTTDILILEAA